MEQYAVDCDWCSHLTYDDEVVITRGKTLCPSCDQSAEECERCETLVSGWDLKRLVMCAQSVCPDCFTEIGGRCDLCKDFEHEEDLVSIDDCDTVCRSCYESNYTSCYSCGNAVHDSDASYHPPTEEHYCYYCFEELPGNLEHTVAADIVAGKVRDGGYGFGVEIETEFVDHCPFELGGYHEKTPAEAEYFIGGWRAEDDGSLDNGGEFVSPPLMGSAGIAEILYTYDVLRDNGAVMRRTCGQHVTVQVKSAYVDGDYIGEYYMQLRVQRLTVALEEALIALTGAFYRLNEQYCYRIKKSGITTGNADRQITCGLKDDGLVEFRYPPGTFSPSQLAMNVGLTQLIVKLAATMTEDEIESLVSRSLEIETGSGSTVGIVHAQVMMGLEFLRSHGWHANGDMDGLPYDPSAAPTVELQDYENGHPVTQVLPSGDDIARRMHRQLTNFYRRMGYESAASYALAQIEEEINV